jgi:hypothetical protein
MLPEFPIIALLIASVLSLLFILVLKKIMPELVFAVYTGRISQIPVYIYRFEVKK